MNDLYLQALMMPQPIPEPEVALLEEGWLRYSLTGSVGHLNTCWEPVLRRLLCSQLPVYIYDVFRLLGRCGVTPSFCYVPRDLDLGMFCDGPKFRKPKLGCLYLTSKVKRRFPELELWVVADARVIQRMMTATVSADVLVEAPLSTVSYSGGNWTFRR